MMSFEGIFYTTLLSAKKHSGGINKEQFNNFLFTYDMINDMDEYSSMLFNYALEDYEIPRLFSFLIKPLKVSFGGDTFFNNLLKKSQYKLANGYDNIVNKGKSCEHVLSPIEFIQTGLNLMGLLKQQPDMQKVMSYRIEALVTDCMDIITNNDLLPINGGSFKDFRLPLKVKVKPYQSFVYSSSLEQYYTALFTKLFSEKVSRNQSNM